MAIRTVFYSFHYERDSRRVQLLLKMGAVQGQQLMQSQEWESVKRRGPQAVQKWIDDQMAYKRAVVVLVGSETASRPWVQYEIKKAWQEKKPLVGIRIHGLSDMGTTDSPGRNPFEELGIVGPRLFDPTATDWRGKIDSQQTYRNLSMNLVSWIDQAKTRVW
ncbi:TIR domain-containing protein [Corynebacterium freneyi]|uniref:TIR domain-containing protein n=1 Tax=Corynebacterium freneyi TaxID=134034 RepID=UPI00396C531D